MTSIEETRERYEQGEGGYFRPSIKREIDAHDAYQDIINGDRQARKLVYIGSNCRHVLAEVFPLDEGILIHQPIYKVAKARNFDESTAEGRKNNTVNGNNIWQRQIWFIGSGHANLNCAHIPDYRISPAQILHDLNSGKAQIKI